MKPVQEIIRSGDDAEHGAWILEVTDEHLAEYIILLPSRRENLHRLALAEQTKRQLNRLSKPHWTLIPSYRILLATLIMTIAVFIVTVLAWLFPRSFEKGTIPLSQNGLSNPPTSFHAAPQTNAIQSQPELPTANQTLPPVI
jgi:hypothetical protein